MRLRIELDEQTAAQLMKAAEAERRPVVWQAEVLLKRALEQMTKREAGKQDKEAAA